MNIKNITVHLKKLITLLENKVCEQFYCNKFENLRKLDTPHTNTTYQNCFKKN